MATTRLLIADDHALVRLGISSVIELEDDIVIVGLATSGEEAVEQYRRLRPCVALFDVRMPGMGGIEALRAVRRDFPDACVLMISTYELDEEVAQAKEAGALGYVVKSHDAAGLAASIRGAKRGLPQFSRAAQQQLRHHIALAPREIEVLTGMAKGLSNKEIALQLHLSPHTVKTYVKGVLAKLDVPDRAGAVAEGYERGLLQVSGKEATRSNGEG